MTTLDHANDDEPLPHGWCLLIAVGLSALCWGVIGAVVLWIAL